MDRIRFFSTKISIIQNLKSDHIALMKLCTNFYPPYSIINALYLFPDSQIQIFTFCVAVNEDYKSVGAQTSYGNS